MYTLAGCAWLPIAPFFWKAFLARCPWATGYPRSEVVVILLAVLQKTCFGPAGPVAFSLSSLLTLVLSFPFELVYYVTDLLHMIVCLCALGGVVSEFPVGLLACFAALGGVNEYLYWDHFHPNMRWDGSSFRGARFKAAGGSGWAEQPLWLCHQNGSEFVVDQNGLNSTTAILGFEIAALRTQQDGVFAVLSRHAPPPGLPPGYTAPPYLSLRSNALTQLPTTLDFSNATADAIVVAAPEPPFFERYFSDQSIVVRLHFLEIVARVGGLLALMLRGPGALSCDHILTLERTHDG